MKRIVVIPDTQCSDHYQPALDAVTNFLYDYKPDKLLHVGDDVDSPEPSRWSKGLAEEYAPTLQKGMDDTHAMHAQLRGAIGDVPYHVMRSNHGDRTEFYIRKYAPALSSLRCLDIAQLLGYDELGITYHRKPFEFEPGWLLLHGDETGLSQVPGSTAMGAARLTGKSVVCGHVHRQGMQHQTWGVNGNTRRRWGIEAGHMMNMRKAKYLKMGSANWSMGFVVLEFDGTTVTPSVVPMDNNGSFIFQGQRWTA